MGARPSGEYGDGGVVHRVDERVMHTHMDLGEIHENASRTEVWMPLIAKFGMLLSTYRYTILNKFVQQQFSETLFAEAQQCSPFHIFL